MAPIADKDLQSITRRACEDVFERVTQYSHTDAEGQNSALINKILAGVVQAAQSSPASSEAAKQPQYKYAVNSTIIQHLGPATSSTSTSTGAGGEGAAAQGADESNGITEKPGSTGVKPEAGRRGMHSATGAFWNSETDGMWSYKWEGGEKKGLDVVVGVIWMAV